MDSSAVKLKTGLYRSPYGLVILRAAADLEGYRITLPVQSISHAAGFHEERRGRFFRVKPDHVETEYSPDHDAWLEYSYSEWAKYVRMEAAELREFVAIVSKWHGYRVRPFRWDPSPSPEPRVAVDIGMGDLDSYQARESLLREGVSPGAMPESITIQPEKDWEELLPTLRLAGWTINPDHREKWATRVLALSELELQESEM